MDFDVLLGPAESLREPSVVERQRRGMRSVCRRAAGAAGAADHRPLPDRPQLGVDQPLVLQPDPLQVRPHPLLNVGRLQVELRGERRVLQPQRFPISGIQHRHAMLKRALQIRRAAQELDLGLLELALPLRAASPPNPCGSPPTRRPARRSC